MDGFTHLMGVFKSMDIPALGLSVENFQRIEPGGMDHTLAIPVQPMDTDPAITASFKSVSVLVEEEEIVRQERGVMT